MVVESEGPGVGQTWAGIPAQPRRGFRKFPQFFKTQVRHQLSSDNGKSLCFMD